MKILLLGYGNPGRQDDGLGPALVAEIEKMALPDVTCQDNYQLVLEDAVEIAAHDVVWFVDAAREGAEPFFCHSIEPAYDSGFTSHFIRPETLLAIAGECCGRAPQAHVLGIRGYEFEFLEGLTEKAAQNLALAVAMMREMAA